MPLLCLIATDIMGGIAREGVIPWHIPIDLKIFRILTMDQIVIMGRKTYDSLPENVRPLPNRFNYVITSNAANMTSNIFVSYGTKDDLKTYIREHNDDNMFFIGGAALHKDIEDMIDGYILTIVHKNYGCDTFIDLDKIRFEKTTLLHDTPDCICNEDTFHFEIRISKNVYDNTNVLFQLNTMQNIINKVLF